MTPWFSGDIKPVRSGAYIRDYTNTPEGGWCFDYWLTDGNIGFWYVNEPEGQWNDAWYENLPWRGLTYSEYLKEKICDGAQYAERKPKALTRLNLF